LNTGNAKWGQYQALIAEGWAMLRYFIDGRDDGKDTPSVGAGTCTPIQ
jgi:hypothetical protein